MERDHGWYWSTGLTVRTIFHLRFDICAQVRSPDVTSSKTLHLNNSRVRLVQLIDNPLPSWRWNDNSGSPDNTSIHHTQFILPPPVGLHVFTCLLIWPAMEDKSSHTGSLSVQILICRGVTGETLFKCSESNRRSPGTGTMVGHSGRGRRLRASA